MSGLVQLLRLEYELTWRARLLGVAYAVIFATYVGGLRITASILPADGWELVLGDVTVGIGYPLAALAVIAAYVYSRSVAVQLSSGLMKTLLAYPVRRGVLLLAKMLLGLILLLPAILLPQLYSWLLHGVNLPLLAVVTLTLALELLFSSSLTTLISLLVKDPASSLLLSLLALLAIAVAPGLLSRAGFEEAAKVFNPGSILHLYDAVAEGKMMGYALATTALYSTLTGLSIALSLLLFNRMDLD